VAALESALHIYPKAVAFWHAMERKLGADFGMKMTGGLMIAEDRTQLDFLAYKAGRERALGLDAQIMERGELDRIAPYLGGSVVGAEFCADEGKLNPLQANAAIRNWAVAAGVHIHDNMPVTAVAAEAGGFRVKTARGEIRAEKVVLAAAAGTRDLAAPFGLSLAIAAEPLHVNITEPVAPFIHHLVQHADRPITLKQFASGHVVIGGGWPARLAGPRAHPTVELASIVGNATLARHIAPAVGQLSIIRTWAGVNTTTDGKGILGPVEEYPGLFIAIPGDAGYTLGPFCARLVADSVLGQPSPEDIAAFSPSRFAQPRTVSPEVSS
jgi:glycine/D-amino acid oxidase-like deaminating enzyme